MVIAIIGILVALLLPAIQAARGGPAQCQSNLHNTALAVLNYESAKKILPTGMNADNAELGSIQAMTHFRRNWLIDILPYLEEQALYDSFDFTRDINDTAAGSVRNYTARGSVISPLLCPSDLFNRVLFTGLNGNWARSNYAGNAGRSFIFSRANPETTPDYLNGPLSKAWSDPKFSPCQRGVMGVNAGLTLRRITDGTSKTMMLGEIRAGVSEDDARRLGVRSRRSEPFGQVRSRRRRRRSEPVRP